MFTLEVSRSNIYVAGKIFRDGSQFYADFSVELAGKLNGAFLGKYIGINIPNCLFKCIQFLPCQSINYHFNLTCELNSATFSTGNFDENNQWIYLETKWDALEV